MFFDLPGGGLLSPIFYLLVAMAHDVSDALQWQDYI